MLVVDAPRMADLPVPMPSMTMPDLGGLALPDVTSVLPPLPAVGAVGLPADAEPVGAWLPPPLVPEPPLVDPAGPPPRFDSGPTAFPLDTVAILGSAPDPRHRTDHTRGDGLMRIGRWLTQLAGARQDVLDQTPGDIPKQTSLGAVLVGTAMMAAVSATFGLVTAVHVPVAVAAMVGLLWGLLILNLDRMLVVSMARRSGGWANIGTAVPRLLLALLIGMVISLPLVLRIFEPEINAELQVMRNEALGQAQTSIDSNPRFAEIPALEAEEQRLQGVVSGTAADDVGSDPDVVRVQKELNAKEAEFTAAERDIICENDGTCGTGVVGRGPSYQEKLDKKNRLEAERNALRNQLAEAENAARQRVQSGN